MPTRSKILVLVAGMCGLLSLLPPVAYAITISVAEVRGDAAFVKGSDAGRKQEIFWTNGDPASGLTPVHVTTANGKGNFSFEGALPAGCPPDNCVGTLTAGAITVPVSLAYQPGEPPSEPVDELEPGPERSDSHGGDAVRAVGFVAGGTEERVVSGGADTYLRNWTLDLSQHIDRDLPHIIYDVDVSGDGLIIATGEGGWNGHAGSHTLRIWEAVGLQLLQTQAPPIGFVYSVAVSPDKESIAVSGFYGDIAVLETSTLQILDTTTTKKKRTQALAFYADGSLLASASTGGIHLWSFPQNCALGDCQLDQAASVDHPGSWSFSIAFAPLAWAKTEIVSASDSGTIKISTLDLENLATEDPTVSVLSVRSVDSGPIYGIAWSKDGTKIVAGGNGDITVYDSTDLRILFRNVAAHAGRVNDVAFSSDGSLIVSGGADGALKLWTVPTP